MDEAFPRGGIKKFSKSTAQKKRKLSHKKTKVKNNARTNSKPTVRRPGITAGLWTNNLSSKVCTPDLLVLGCVRNFLTNAVLIELPDGLTGVLSITDISTVFSKQLLARGGSIEDSVKLQDLFTIGQLIGCKIKSVSAVNNKRDDSTNRTSSRIHLTTNPSDVNSFISTDLLFDGMVLNAAVRSVEEKGYLMDLGLLQSDEYLAFLPFDDCGENHRQKSDTFRVGQVLLCSISETPAAKGLGKRTIRLTVSPQRLNNGLDDVADRYLRREQFLPGLVFEGVVEKIIVNRGLVVRFGPQPEENDVGGTHFWRAFVPTTKLKKYADKPTDYQPNQKLKMVVLYNMINSTVFGLSAQTHLTKIADSHVRIDLLNYGTMGDVKEGLVHKANLKLIEFELDAKKNVYAKATRRHIDLDIMDEENDENEDENMRILEEKFSRTSRHKFRIVGHSFMGRFLYADARKSTIKQPIINVESTTCGASVKAVVTKIGEKGVFFKLYDRVNGYAPAAHCVDSFSTDGTSKIRLRTKFTVGQTVKARVLQIDKEKNRLILTLKNSLIDSSTIIVDDFDTKFVDEIADGVVVHINDESGILVTFYGPARGWLPKMDLTNAGYVDVPLSKLFSLGQTVRVRIAQVDAYRRKMQLTPAVNYSENAKEKSEEKVEKTPEKIEEKPKFLAQKMIGIAVGGTYWATVVKIEKYQLDLSISNRYKGRVFVTELEDRPTDGSFPLRKFSIGQQLRVRVIGLKTKRRTGKKKKMEKDETKTYRFADCTLKMSKLHSKKGTKKFLDYKNRFGKGDTVEFVVEKFEENTLHVVVNPLWKGTVSLLKLSENADDIKNAQKNFIQGQIYTGKIVAVQQNEKRLELTRLLTSKSARVQIGMATMCTVIRAANEKKIAVKCRMKDDSSGFIFVTDFDEDFENITEKIVSAKEGDFLVVTPMRKETNGQWRLTTRNPNECWIRNFDDAKPGMIVRGFVLDRRPNGYRILLGYRVYGYADKTKLDPEEKLNTGDLICAEVVSADTDNKKIQLSVLSVDKKGVLFGSGRKRRLSSEENADEDQFPASRIKRQRTQSQSSVASSFTFESILEKKSAITKFEDSENRVGDEVTRIETAAKMMNVGGFFEEGNNRFTMTNLMDVCLADGKTVKTEDSDTGSEVEDSDEMERPKKRAKTKVKSKFEREKLEERLLREKEMSLLDPDRPPEATDDFDRLLMGSPNSSLIWIQYMAFFLQTADVAKARAVAERALKTITSNEENERLNLWTALLNLENDHGTPETMKEVFDRAVAVNEPLKIYQIAAKIYRKSNKIQDGDKLHENMLRKFKSEFNVWLSVGDYYMGTGRAEKARDLMRRAMRSLAQNVHVDLVSRFAQMEYRYSTEEHSNVGDAERGRTLFENLLRDCPKRTDIWSVYVDMTLKYRNIEETRPIFERVTSMKLNAHNMRLFYKKWIEMEERRGTAETLAQVKRRAAEYVKDSLSIFSSGGKEVKIENSSDHEETLTEK